MNEDKRRAFDTWWARYRAETIRHLFEHEDAQWSSVARHARQFLGDQFGEFVELVDLAYERHHEGVDPLLARYNDAATRPTFLIEVRRLLSHHAAMLRREGLL